MNYEIYLEIPFLQVINFALLLAETTALNIYKAAI